MSPEEIRARRLALGWTQAQLAAAAGTSQQTIDRLERGEVRHARALPAVVAALSPKAPAGAAASISASMASYDAPSLPRAPGLCSVYGAIPDREDLRFTAAVEVLPPPPMLDPIWDAYGISLEGDIAPFRRGDVLWFNPMLRPRYGGPGLLLNAETVRAPGPGAKGRLLMSVRPDANLAPSGHRLVAAYFRGSEA